MDKTFIISSSGTETAGWQRRAEERKSRIRAHRAGNWADAEQWDLEFWQRQSAQDRLSALVALRNDLAAVHGDLTVLDWSD